MPLDTALQQLTEWGNKIIIPQIENLIKEIPAHYELTDSLNSFFLARFLNHSDPVIQNYYAETLAKKFHLPFTGSEQFFATPVNQKSEGTGYAEIPILTFGEVAKLSDIAILRMQNTWNYLTQPYTRNPNESLIAFIRFCEDNYPHLPDATHSLRDIPATEQDFFYFYFLRKVVAHVNNDIVYESLRMFITFYHLTSDFYFFIKKDLPAQNELSTMLDRLDILINDDTNRAIKTIKTAFPGVYENIDKQLSAKASLKDMDPEMQIAKICEKMSYLIDNGQLKERKYEYFSILQTLFELPWERLHRDDSKRATLLSSSYQHLIGINRKFEELIDTSMRHFNSFKTSLLPSSPLNPVWQNNAWLEKTNAPAIVDILVLATRSLTQAVAPTLPLIKEIQAALLKSHALFEKLTELNFISNTLARLPIDQLEAMADLKSQALKELIDDDSTSAASATNKPSLINCSDIQFLRTAAKPYEDLEENTSPELKRAGYLLHFLKEITDYDKHLHQPVMQDLPMYYFSILENYFFALKTALKPVYKFIFSSHLVATIILNAYLPDSSKLEQTKDNLKKFIEIASLALYSFGHLLHKEELDAIAAELNFVHRGLDISSFEKFTQSLNKELQLAHQSIENLAASRNLFFKKRPLNVNSALLQIFEDLYHLINASYKNFVQNAIQLHFQPLLQSLSLFKQAEQANKLLAKLPHDPAPKTTLFSRPSSAIRFSFEPNAVILKQKNGNETYSFSEEVSKLLQLYLLSEFDDLYDRSRPKSPDKKISSSQKKSPFFQNAISPAAPVIISPAFFHGEGEKMIEDNPVFIQLILSEPKTLAFKTDHLEVKDEASSIPLDYLAITFTHLLINSKETSEIKNYLFPYINYLINEKLGFNNNEIKNMCQQLNSSHFEIIIIFNNELEDTHREEIKLYLAKNLNCTLIASTTHTSNFNP